MYLLIIALLLILLIFGPQWWARSVLRHYSRPRPDYPGNGGQFARHLLDKFGMDNVRVENTEQGDHYDPVAKVVRLTPDNLNGKSLTAVTVAAHEVGHAIQDHLGYAPLAWRARLVGLAQTAQKTGSGVMMVLPLVALITRSPAASVVMFVVGLGSMAVGTVVHLITLPVEWDASFGRALPLLEAGRYLKAEDERAARRILKACALTYVASSLASLLNVWRWLRFWRR
jgi:Zn-dependent membrane protease YugP